MKTSLLSFALALGLLQPLSLGASSAETVSANIFVNLSKKIVPSVVNISTFSTVKSPLRQGSPDDLFRNFFEDFLRRHGGEGAGPGDEDNGGGGDQEEDDTQSNPAPSPKNLPRAISLGTGFIIDSSGLILTNNHVVAGADEIKITFTEEADEEPTTGEVVGRDTEIDVALIRVQTKRELKPLPLGDSDALEVGEYVIAVGNPFGQGHSVTHGIISAKGRTAPEFPLATYLQTDAPINPGNSGGPLVNLKGEVIGINNAIQQHAQGIGFAIPINLVKKVLPQLRTKGTVEYGFIGVLVNDLTPEIGAQLNLPKNLKAPFVTQIYPGEPADKAGLKNYDVILEFNGKPIHTYSDLVSGVTAVPVGTSVPIKVLRAGKELNLEITVAKRKNPEAAQEPKPKKKKGKKENHINAGMTLEDVTADVARDLGMPDKSTGAVISSIDYGGPADRAGLGRGDVIVEVDRKPVKDVDSFYAIVKSKKSYLLRVRRGDAHGNESFAVVVLDLKS
jgi:serine protease Do